MSRVENWDQRCWIKTLVRWKLTRIVEYLSRNRFKIQQQISTSYLNHIYNLDWFNHCFHVYSSFNDYMRTCFNIQTKKLNIPMSIYRITSTCKHLGGIDAWWSRHQVDPPSSVVSALSTTTPRGAPSGVIRSQPGTIQLSACVPILHSQLSLTVFSLQIWINYFLHIVAALCYSYTSKLMFLIWILVYMVTR